MVLFPLCHHGCESKCNNNSGKKSIELIQCVKNPCCLDCLASKGKSRIDIFGNGK